MSENRNLQCSKSLNLLIGVFDEAVKYLRNFGCKKIRLFSFQIKLINDIIFAIPTIPVIVIR
jgi:hypothetical protein